MAGAMELFPAIDLHDRGAVRLVQGDFGRARAYGDPMALAPCLRRRAGRRGSTSSTSTRRAPGSRVNRDIVLEIAAAVDMPVQAGGGVRGRRRRRGPARPRRGARRARHRRARDTRAGRGAGGALPGPGGGGPRPPRAPSWPCGAGSARARPRSTTRSTAWPAGPRGGGGDRHRARRHARRARSRRTRAPCSSDARIRWWHREGCARPDDLAALAGLRGAGRPGVVSAGAIVGTALVERAMTVEEAIAACVPSE